MSFSIAFFVAAIVLAVTPGPSITYVIARTVAANRAEGLASCAGTGLGGMFHVFASAVGISLLIAQSALAFSLVKYLGAAYLVYIGIRLLLRAQADLSTMPVKAQGARRAFVEGVLIEGLNVKTALFFLAFLPQFVTPDGSLVYQLVVLGTICVLLNTLADVAAVFLADWLMRAKALRTDRARTMSRASGVTMLGLGAYLALFSRAP